MERLDIFSENLRECISLDVFNDTENATHVVIEIEWGANAMVTLNYSNEEQEDVKNIQGSLKAELSLMATQVCGVSGKAGIAVEKTKRKKNLHFSLKMFADAVALEDSVPQTVEQALAFMKRMPNAMREANNGRGKALQYTLLPLSTIAKYLKITSLADRLVKILEEESIARVVELFDDIVKAEQKINDLYNDCVKYEYCIPDNRIKQIKRMVSSITAAKGRLRVNLNSTLIEVRSGRKHATELDELVDDFERSNVSYDKCLSFVTENSDLVEKMQFVHDIRKQNVLYIGKSSFIETERRRLKTDNSYVLFLGQTQDRKRNRDNKEYFYQLSVENNNIARNYSAEEVFEKKDDKISKILCTVVDFDVQPKIQSSEGVPEGVRICSYKNGKYICTDVLEENEENKQKRKDEIDSHSITDTPGTLNAQSFLNDSHLHGVIPGEGSVTGLTVLDSQLFVVQDGSSVNVYDTTNLTLSRNITIRNSSHLRAIVASPSYNCLYLSDDGLKVVHRYNLSDNIIRNWCVSGLCSGLSLTSTQNVLVTLWDTKQIKEFTPDGSLVREINLDRSLVEPWHSVRLSTGQFVVSHGYFESIHRVCIVDGSGHIVQSYGGSQGSGVEQWDGPTSLAVDGHSNVIVTDLHNNRVVVLNHSLTHLGYIKIPGSDLSYPRTLHLHLLTRRLYIGEETSGKVFILTV